MQFYMFQFHMLFKYLIRFGIHFLEYILKDDDDDEKPEDETISSILLWAIFANRKELAEICWLKVENHLCRCFFFPKKNSIECIFG